MATIHYFPDSYFIVRNKNGAPDLSLTSVGSVLMKKTVVPFLTQANQPQDNAVAMIRPVSVPLDLTGLAPFDRSFERNDQLLLFDNSKRGFDKTPSATYVFNGGWKLASDPNAEHGADLIAPGTAILVRKAAISNGSVFWINAPTYVAQQGIRPLQVASRKVHGTAGSFDVNLPQTGSFGIEPRRGGTSGTDFEIVATFPSALSALAGARISSRDNLARMDQPRVSTLNGHGVVLLNLHNVSNGQILNINLLGASDGSSTTDVTVPMGVLMGDVNASQLVDVNDAAGVQNHIRQSANSSNFEYDVDLNGLIDGRDLSATQRQAGTSIK